MSEHIQIREGLSYAELRELYQGARVVVPVNPETDYAASVNAILEATSCERAVVASETRTWPTTSRTDRTAGG